MRDAVHVVGQLLAVEMDAGALPHVVRERRPDAVTLDHREPRSRPDAVEAECLDRVLRGVDAVVHLLDGQLEDLHAALDTRLERGVALALEGGALATEEPLDRRQRVRVVVHRGPADGALEGGADPWGIDGADDAAPEGSAAAPAGAADGP